MSMDSPPVPDSPQPDKTACFAATTTAWVALGFCLVVVGLLLVNAVQARTHEPIAPAQIELLRAQLGADPKNDALRTQIRDLDQSLRSGYFIGRARAIQGTYLLAFGIAVFLVSSHLAASLRAKLSPPNPEAAGRSWTDAALSLRSIVALALVMAGFLLTMLMVARHDASAEYIRAAKEMSASGTGAGTTGVPDPALGSAPLPGGPPPPGGLPGATAKAPTPPPPLSGAVRRPGGGGRVPPPPGAKAPGPAPAAGTPAPTSEHHPQPSAPSPAAGEAPKSWPMFRGPAGAWAQTADFPTRWDAANGEGIAWKMVVPLPGHSSPIFCEGRVFLTGADETQRAVYAIDAATGQVAWTQPFAVQPGAGPEPPKVQKDTGYAAPTMAADTKRVFAIFPNGDVGAWDLDGKPAWAKALGTPKNAYGYAASLAIHEDRLIIQLDQGSEPEKEQSALVALDTATGQQAWRTPRPVRNSWSSPIVVTGGSGAQVITAADPFVIGYDAKTGKELWRAKGLRGDGGPSPCYADGLAYACTDLAGLFAIRTSDGDGKKAGDVVWSGDEGLPDISSPVTNGELLFLAAGYGVVTCYDAKQGTKLWEQDFKTTFESSPVIVGKRVYVSDMDGVTHIFEATREYKAVGQSAVGEPVTATSAFINGRIYLRGEKHLYCIGPKETAQ